MGTLEDIFAKVDEISDALASPPPTEAFLAQLLMEKTINTLVDTLQFTSFNNSAAPLPVVDLFDTNSADLTQPPPVDAFVNDLTTDIESPFVAGAGSPFDTFLL